MNLKRLILIGLIILLPASVRTQQPQFNTTQYRAAFAVETLTISSVSKTLTAATFAPVTSGVIPAQTRADYAYITVETDCIRFWPNGTAPTSSVGHKVCDGGSFYVYSYNNLLNLHMIRVTTDATIQVSYYRFSSNTQ